MSTSVELTRPRSSGKQTGRMGSSIPALDGVRALAIAAVVLYHYGHLPGGFLGVDLFFVLSGYLITRQILGQQHAHGDFSLGWFWLRRVRRLASALLVVIAVVLVWVFFLDSPSLWTVTVGQGRSALVYGTNWYNILTQVGYFDVKIPDAPLNHLWSLAIEEQFYLVWPLLTILFIRRWKRPRVLAVVAGLLAVASMLITPLIFSSYGQNAAYLGTETRIGAILLGATSALLAHHRTISQVSPGPLGKVLLTLASMFGLAFFTAAVVLSSFDTPDLANGGLALTSFAEVALVAGIAFYPSGVLGRFFSFAPLVALGRRSYSLYLWHFPIYALLSPQYTSLNDQQILVWRIVLTAAATEISYRLIENPIRRSAIPGRKMVVLALLPAIAIFGFTLAPLPVPPPSATVIPISSGEAVPADAANLRVMVAGDSWGLRTAYGLGVMAPPRPAQVFNDAQPSCGITDPLQSVGYNGNFPPTPQCLAWKTKWAETINNQRPDAVIFNIGNWDQAAQQLTDGGPFLKPCDPDFQTRYNTQLDTALNILTTNKTPVFMTNVRDNDGGARTVSDCMNNMLSSAAARFASRGVYLLDLRQELCGSDHTCPSELHGQRVYDETGHLFITTQVTVNAWELQSILKKVTPAQTNTGPQQTAVPQVPTDALALDSSLRVAFTQSQPAFPAGTVGVTESDQLPDSSLPAVLQSSAATIKTSVPSARLRVGPATTGPQTTGRVFAYQFTTDTPADQIATALQRYLQGKNANIKVSTDNQKSFTFSTPAGTETIGYLRKPNSVVVIDLTGPIPNQQDAVNAYLTALSKQLGT